MRILWVIRPAEGGMLNHISQLLLGMPDLEIVIAAPATLQKLAQGRKFFPVEIGDRVQFRSDWQAVREVRRLIRRIQPQLVHIHGLKAALITAAALSFCLKRPRLVFTVHNNLPQPQGLAAQMAYAFAYQKLLRRMDVVIAVSDALREQLVAYTNPARVHTIRNGIPLDRFRGYSRSAARAAQGVPENAKVVGMTARLIASKGVSTALKAMSLLGRIVPELHFVVVGDGPERARLEQYAKALGLGNAVHFLGWRDDVPQLMAGWDLFILPSLGEGLSLSVLEAMASGLPVVVSDLAGMREAVVAGKSGYLTKPGDAPELAAAVLNLLRNSRRAQQMGEFNRQRAAALFGQEQMITCTRAVYEELCRS